MKARTLTLASLLIATISTGAIAEEQQSDQPGDWSWSMSLYNLSIDSEAATRQGVEDNALALGIYADYQKNHWLTTLGADIVVYDDNDGFSQEVVGDGLFNSGDRSTASSDATGVILTVASGYQWFFGENENLSTALQGGFGIMVSSSREISNCSNCYSEDIDLDGGAFIKASVTNSGDSLRFGGFVQQYVSGDLGTAIGIQLGGAF